MSQTTPSDLVRRTMEAVQANNMEAYYVPTAADVVPFVEQLVPQGAVVSNGGSVTLMETGVMDHLASGRYDFLDRTKVQGEELFKLYRDVFNADWYFASANAVTEAGEIYEVDANANRVAAISFGPRNVLLVVGENKIVPDLAAAEERVRLIAAPKNTVRLNCKTPCTVTGKCEDCASPGRICCTTMILRRQRHAMKGRIKVLFVGEALGY
ncbi:MAG: lactate utilization protein [Oscillospiraceae bacterium]|nr:lactate utilization protein [Oscillospiraceae bacterium]